MEKNCQLLFFWLHLAIFIVWLWYGGMTFQCVKLTVQFNFQEPRWTKPGRMQWCQSFWRWSTSRKRWRVNEIQHFTKRRQKWSPCQTLHVATWVTGSVRGRQRWKMQWKYGEGQPCPWSYNWILGIANNGGGHKIRRDTLSRPGRPGPGKGALMKELKPQHINGYFLKVPDKKWLISSLIDCVDGRKPVVSVQLL